RFRPALVMAAGLALAALGFGLLTQAGADTGLGLLVTGSFLYSAGVAPALTLSTDMIVAAAPPERAGAAAAIAETGSELGGARGSAPPSRSASPSWMRSCSGASEQTRP